MKLKENILFMLLAVCSTNVICQDSSMVFAQTVFYKAEKEGRKPLYLFGTMHLICNGSQIKFNNVVIEAIKESDFLYMETDFDNPINLLGIIGKMKSKVALPELLSEQELAKLDSFWVANELKPDLRSMYKRKPFFLMSYITQKMTPCKDRTSMEILLMKLNRDEKVFDMPTEGFESIRFQMGLFDQIPLETQAEFLMDKIENIEEDQSTLNQLMECYLRGDINCVSHLISSDQNFPIEYKDLFLTQRNRKWIDIILKKNNSKNGLFIAVGCGHLLNDYGLLKLLHLEGYNITPLANPFSVGEE